MAESRANVGGFLLPNTPGAYLTWIESEARAQEAQAKDDPEVRDVALAYARVLRDYAVQLRTVGVMPEALQYATQEQF